MSKFNVTFVPTLKKPDETVEADDLCAVSDYTVQFMDSQGKTVLVLGGVERVQRVEDAKPFEFSTTDTTGRPAIVPHGSLDEPTSGHPCQCSEAATVQEDASDTPAPATPAT